jgi:hypothetical protein
VIPTLGASSSIQVGAVARKSGANTDWTDYEVTVTKDAGE